MSLRRTLQLALAVVATSLVLAFSSGAGAVDNPDYVKPAERVKNATPQSVSKAPSVAAPVRQRLAITGSDATGMVVLGSLLIAGGAATLLVRRRSLT